PRRARVEGARRRQPRARHGGRGPGLGDGGGDRAQVARGVRGTQRDVGAVRVRGNVFNLRGGTHAPPRRAFGPPLKPPAVRRLYAPPDSLFGGQAAPCDGRTAHSRAPRGPFL